MSSLYKDAIADARKLREAAEANAKNRIVEAITPKLRRLIEKQINEGDDELVDDLETDELIDAEETLDGFDDEESYEMPEAEPMDLAPAPMDMDTDGLASIEVVPDEAEEDLEELEIDEYEDERQDKSIHVNITVEGKRKKRNYLLRHRAIRLVKALSEAKTRKQRQKLRKELNLLRKALIITENSQNKRLAKNLSVILKESKTMRRRRNSWLFEGKDEAGAEEIEFEDAEFEEGGDTIEVDAAALEDALGLEAGTISDASGGDDDLDMEDDMDDLDMDDDEDLDDLDLDLDESDEMYETMNESDETDEDECSEDDEVVEVNESMLRRALGAQRRRRTPRRRTSRRVNESRRRRIARRRRYLREGEAKSSASQFGGGKLEKEMFVDVDENTLLNALAEELGSYNNATANQGQASAKASHFGGGSVKKGAVMEARRHRRTKRVLAETKRRANKVARSARAAKAELKESNLFNAKLLFVTKLLQQHSLNNKQQRAIIEAMDNAKTQREAKLLFSSLNESLNKRSMQKRQARSSSRLNENRSRTGTTSRSLRSGQAPRGNAVELDRWAVLAGIKK